MKTARRVCPLRAASGRCLHLYPEATSAIRALPSSKDAGMRTYLSSRLHCWPDDGFTVGFLSPSQFMVRADLRIGNGIFPRIVPGTRAARLGAARGQAGTPIVKG